MEKEKIEYLPIGQLEPFKNHPFRIREGEEKENLKKSISENGTIEPLVVRPLDGGRYEVISGHRRMQAAKELGIEKLPVIIRELTDEQAVSMMVDANLHREKLLPSERAYAYKMKLEAVKNQRKNFRQPVAKSESADLIDENSGRQVQRFIRLTCLIPEILGMVDEGQIAFTPAVEISYLTKEEQKNLFDAMEYNGCTPSYAQAVRLKKMSQEKGLYYSDIYNVLSEEKPNQKETLKIPEEKLKKYFRPGSTDAEKEEFILKALEYYDRYLRRMREREER